MFDDTVTIFNQYKEKGVVTWYPHVLSGVELQPAAAVTVQKEGKASADKASLHIPFREDYRKPKEWKNSEDKQHTFTIAEEDFFVEGIFDIEKVDDDEYPNGLFEYMKQSYDDVYNITSVNRYKTVPHFEVGGN